MSDTAPAAGSHRLICNFGPPPDTSACVRHADDTLYLGVLPGFSRAPTKRNGAYAAWPDQNQPQTSIPSGSTC